MSKRIYATYWLETRDDPVPAAEVIAGNLFELRTVTGLQTHDTHAQRVPALAPALEFWR